MKSTNTRRGFSLIELLVVVLIIGILAAVALPQYQQAVLRSRLAAIKPLLSKIKNAEELYYLANGTYTAILNNTDINFSTESTQKSNFKIDNYFRGNLLGSSAGNMYISVRYCPGDTSNNTLCDQNSEFVYTVWFEHSNNPNIISCVGYTNLGRKLCKMEVNN